MREKEAQFWMGLIFRFMHSRTLRKLPYDTQRKLITFVEHWAKRNGVLAALPRSVKVIGSGGGYVLPHDTAKAFFRDGLFDVYWEMEGADLKDLIKRLESYRG